MGQSRILIVGGGFVGLNAALRLQQKLRPGEARITVTLRGGQLRTYRHAYAGSVASLGVYKGVAEVYGVKLRGWPAWALHRMYHASRVPTFNRKARTITDWTLATIFPREVVSLGSLARPRREFKEYAVPAEPQSV